MRNRTLIFVALVLASWGVMTVTHELGHLVAGWVIGAKLVDYDLSPWRLPYSIHQPDPHPRVTIWGGPIFGVLVPLLIAAVIPNRATRFIANFCLIANGMYLAVSAFSSDPHLDTLRLLRAGERPWVIALYCLVTIGIGYFRFRKDCISIFRTPVVSKNAAD
jgi:hypothetical protein